MADNNYLNSYSADRSNDDVSIVMVTEGSSQRSSDRSRDRDSRRDRRDRGRESRDYDRDRRDRDRHDKSSSRDDRRDSDRSSERSRRSRSRSREPRYRDHGDDSYSNDLHGGGDDDYSYRRGRGRPGKGLWNDSIPNNIILLRGLPEDMDEQGIMHEMAKLGNNIKDVRLLRSKESGLSRRLCFVEFHTVVEAQRWMEANQGEWMLKDQYPVTLFYSTSRRGNMSSAMGMGSTAADQTGPDWVCSKCNCENFRRRSHCRLCKNSRAESERVMAGDGFDQVGSNPCNTLIFRGLDGLTTEDNLLTALAKVSTYPVKNVRVIRDPVTGASNGFAFIEMHSLRESQQLLESLQALGTALEVDGKAVMVAYAKNTFNTALTTLEMQQQRRSQPGYTSHVAYAGSTEYDAYGTQQQQSGYYDYSAYYAAQSSASGTVTQTDSTNAAAAVAQAAIMNAAQKKQQHTTAHSPAVLSAAPALHGAQQPPAYAAAVTAATAVTEYPQYPVPDVSTYQYDESSGYYYDATTGLYYDAGTQYYYNAQTQQYLYWDSERMTYMPAPDAGTDSDEQRRKNLEEAKRREEEAKKKAPSPDKKVKVAKKVVKDMEKWAKKLNAQKAAMKEETQKVFQQASFEVTAAAAARPAGADAGFALLEKVSFKTPSLDIVKPRDNVQSMPVPQLVKPEAAKAVAEAEQRSEDMFGRSSSATSLTNVTCEADLTDWTKLACLLCRRAFPSKDVLTKHNQMSDLHKKNLAEFQQSQANSQDLNAAQYRDRAKERRDKYGLPEPPQPKRKPVPVEEPIPFEQPTVEGLKDDNIGNKLMQKMGWKDGQGLGRSNQGMVDPIQAKQRQSQAGLGARGSNSVVDQSGSYKERARRTFIAIFNEMEGNE